MKVVIVGNGIAGTALVEEILRLSSGKDIRIQVFGDEKFIGYNRVLITEVLAGRKTLSEIYIKRWQWYEEKGVRLEIGKKVERLFPNKKILVTKDGEFYRYDKAIIATGSKPFIPPSIKGVNKKGVFTYRTAKDVFEILDYARVSKRAVVIGGGLLGIEVTKALRDIGLEVFLVHILDTLMEQQLDKTASELLRKDLEDMGIKVLLKKVTEEILGEKKAEGVRFSDGDELLADFVIIATGIRPNVEVGVNSGLKVNKGIVVNDYLETSASDIYAVGECIEHRGKTYGLVAPIMEQVKVCAHNVVHGNEKKYTGSLTYAMLKVAGVNLFSAGEINEKDGDEVVAFLDNGRSLYRKAVIRNNKIVGTILYGDVRGNNYLLDLIKSGKDISEERPYFLIKHILPKGTTGVEELKDNDIVCNCNAVTKGEIVKCIKEGCKTLEEIQERTKASTSCGSCIELVEEILKHYVKEKPKRVNKIEVIKKELHPFDLEFKKRLEKYFSEGELENIPEEDRDVRLKWYGIFYRKATPGYFMVRIRVPNGRLSYEQAKVVSHISEKFCRGEVEITSRQQLQIRWIKLKDLPEILEALNRVGLSTLQTGMDNVRNVTGDPLTGLAEDSLIDTLRLSQEITNIFLGKKKYADLPRKLNVAVLGSQTDCINALFNDVCFYLSEKDGKLGFNLYLGGKIGSGGPKKAIDMDMFVEPYEVPEVFKATLDIYSTFGNRENRSKNRLYFLLQEWGVERFREELEKRLYKAIPSKGKDLVNKTGEREGIINLRNGTYAVCVVVPAGKIKAKDFRQIAELARKYGSRELRLSVYQNIYIPNIPEENLNPLLGEEIFEKFSTVSSPFTMHLIACAGSDTCSFGVIPNKSDAVRVAKYLSERLKLDIPVRMHWSACAKGCGQHGSGDIGFVGTKTKLNGKAVLAVDVFVGGSPTKEGFKVIQGLPLDKVEEASYLLLNYYLENRLEGESFADFAHRVGVDKLKVVLTSLLQEGECKLLKPESISK
ncbi:FAD-dependent oxidoreductase [Aquifex aeolicus]|uniref:Nitrite reductase (NAD(P)H) large subunit n=1 Tax=Aquifex aeolicus (strain VF5) TaxID=224324 RepID=O66583_AQUAE|nr:FAD-dependent oxidoreductase [Aquifex aeolicus]AAC06543.1 nitrite reductase (NAD(P)H) large subunit [Aquifex aeolicus VF5]